MVHITTECSGDGCTQLVTLVVNDIDAALALLGITLRCPVCRQHEADQQQTVSAAPIDRRCVLPLALAGLSI